MGMEWGCECQLCGGRRGVVFCGAHAARLCLQCDQALHQADGGDHPRAPLCDSCNAAAADAELRLGVGVVTLCGPCAYPYAANTGNTATTTTYTYTGCPAPLEMMRLLSPHRDQLLFLSHHAAPPPPDLLFPGPAAVGGSSSSRDAAMALELDAAAARIIHHLQPQSATCSLQQGGGGEQVLPTLLSATAAPTTCSNKIVAMPIPPAPLLIMMIRNIHKREERNRAKLRYNDKKKRRKFCKQIKYACRKAGADRRKRVKGRFAKASSSSSSSIDHRL